MTSATGKTLNRGDFLRLSGTGLAGAALLSIAGFACGPTEEISVLSLGVKPSNTGAQNRAALLKALTNSSDSFVFPPGDYLIDNAGSYPRINNFGGKLTMQPGARFVFTDNVTGGLAFEKGMGAEFYGLRSTFRTPPSSRIIPQECLMFWKTTDTVLKDVDINGSASAGLFFYGCIKPSVDGVVVRNTMADGVHFANCQQARVNDVFTENTGDDGLAFVNYADGLNYSGGLATNVTVRASRSRGIAVLGQRGVVVNDFTVEGTSHSGVYCAYETSWNTRVPSNVRFANGTVRDAGTTSGLGGPGYGAYFEEVASVEFANMRVFSPRTRGVSGISPGGVVRLTGMEVQDAPESGFDLKAKELRLDDLTVRGSGSTGFYVAESQQVRYGKLTAINTSKGNALHRAFSFENNAKVEGRELHVVDDQTAPTGFKVATFGQQAGTLGTIHNRVANGEVEVENTSGLILL